MHPHYREVVWAPNPMTVIKTHIEFNSRLNSVLQYLINNSQSLKNFPFFGFYCIACEITLRLSWLAVSKACPCVPKAAAVSFVACWV